LTKPKVVLVVDDRSDLRSLIADMLRGAGYSVLEAAGGPEGLSIANDRERHLDLVITDVVMPRMSGTEFVNRIRKMHPGMRVLYISGYGVNALDGHGSSTSRCEVLRKPFGPEDLIQAVSRILFQPEIKPPVAC